jgi:hypothetical protein
MRGDVSRRVDLVSLVAGVALCALGTLILLDEAGTLDLTFGYLLAALAATVGAILLASGLAKP